MHKWYDMHFQQEIKIWHKCVLKTKTFCHLMHCHNKWHDYGQIIYRTWLNYHKHFMKSFLVFRMYLNFKQIVVSVQSEYTTF